MDLAHKKTDEILENLEKELNKIYKESYFECKAKLQKKQKTIDDLANTQDIIKRNEMLRKRDWLESLLKDIMLSLNFTNVIATKMINKEMIDIYYFNFAYLGYTIEKNLNARIGFNVFNQSIIKKVLEDNYNPFTMLAIDNLKDKAIVYSQFKRELAKGLLQGESITKLAKRIEKVVNTNHNSSLAIARTETTRVENVARLDTFKFAEDKNIKIKKQWISTIDKRTRKSHRRLMQEVRNVDEKFSNGLMFPGDNQGRIEETINCRCTMISIFPNLEQTQKELELDEKIKNMSFEEWQDYVS